MTHGKASSYAKYGCRCEACTRAQRVRMREYRKRLTEVVPSTPPRSIEATTEKRARDAGTSGPMASKDGTP